MPILKVMRRCIISSTTALSILLLAGMAPLLAEEQKAADGPIKIGLLTSTSGVAGDSGQDMINGMNLYLEQVYGKMAGREVQLIVENDGSSKYTAVAKLKKLTEQDHVDVLVGPILSNIAVLSAPVAIQAHTPLLLPVTGADALTVRTPSPWVIRLSNSSSQVNYPFGDWVSKNLKYKKIVTIGSDYPLAYESVGGFQKSFEASGGQIIQKLWMPLGFKDFREYIKQINPAADAIYVVTPVGAGEIFAKQLKVAFPKLPIIGAGPTFDETVIRHVGDEVIGAVNSFIYSQTLDNPANKKFVKAYKEKFKQAPSHMSEGCYVAGMCIDEAIKAVHGNTSNKEQFLAALRAANLEGAPRGPMKLDERNNPIENVYIFKVQKVNGHLVNVPIFTYPNVSLFWKYKPSDIIAAPAYSKDYPPCKYAATVSTASTASTASTTSTPNTPKK